MSDIMKVVVDLRYGTHRKEIEEFREEYQRRKEQAEQLGEKFNMPSMFWEMWAAYRRLKTGRD